VNYREETELIFTLEALKAKHGDALLLHYGADSNDLRLIVVDGGPHGVYAPRLLPRLEEIRAQRSPGKPLRIRLVVVSHIDEDHIQGLLEMTEHLLDLRAAGDPPPFKITRLWHNSFGDLVKKVDLSSVKATEARLRSAVFGEEVLSALGIDHPAALVLASVSQGRDLRNNAKALGMLMNSELIVAPESGQPNVQNLGDGLSFTVVGPMQVQINRLQNEWAKRIEDMREKGTLSEVAYQVALSDLVDRSVYNLSSIVVLASFNGKTMLLTGDARWDHILEGLSASNKLPGGATRVDLLKIQHHGSNRNVRQEFFERVLADHYVISADGTGKDANPDVEMFEWLFQGRKNTSQDEPYTIYMTYRVDRIVRFLEDEKPANVKIRYPEEGKHSVWVDLGDALAV
jgi:hypothetical protein